MRNKILTLFPLEENKKQDPELAKFFDHTDLGALYKNIPFEELEALLPEANPRGRKSILSRRGMLATVFLKFHFREMSDRQLLEQLNTNRCVQLFCGLSLPRCYMIRDRDLLWRTRSWVSRHVDLKRFQQVMFDSVRGDIEPNDLGCLLMDATCVESRIRFPTDLGLCWEICTRLRALVLSFDGLDKRRLPRTHEGLTSKVLAYRKRRRGARRRERGLLRTVLGHCRKYIFILKEKKLSDRDARYLETATTVVAQQLGRLADPSRPIKDRIVSTHKPYLRPIVRGKAHKDVEFGAKVHLLQIGGVNVVEHVSFDAFNECKRLIDSVSMHESFTGRIPSFLGADGIYATNENRLFTASKGIRTNFVRKGPAPKVAVPNENTARSLIARARATQMEGAFGNAKNHAGLQKLRAKTAQGEILCIYFSVWTANLQALASKQRRRRAAAA